MPAWMKSSWFRYGFLLFFFIMFFIMLYNTCLVFAGISDRKEVVTLLWTVKVPWHWAYHGTVFSQGVAQFAFGFYSVMLNQLFWACLQWLSLNQEAGVYIVLWEP